MRLPALLLALAALPGCGDNLDPAAPDGGAPPDGPLSTDVVDQLDRLPGVTAVEVASPFPIEGYRYVDLRFTEPVDHDDPSAGTFELHAMLMHRDPDAPLVVYTSGYDLGWGMNLTEPATILEANQLSLEYRFYGSSRPAEIPWPLLRIEQMAADEHDVLAKLAAIYHGATIGTGGSKGGEHALAYAQLHPEDMDGVVAYVAPVITDLPDARYDGILDRIGVPACRDALRAVAHRMLERKDALDARAVATGTLYDVAGVDHAVETAIVELEFGFWMTRGEAQCGQVPDAATATDAALYTFLDQTGSPAAYGDEVLATSGSQYIYQDMVELGYPVWNHAYLDDLLQYSYEDWSAYLPPGEPVPYDPSHARALAAWVTGTAEHVLLVDGEWDPWGAGYPALAPGRDALQVWTPHGSHWSTGIYSLTPDDQTAAVDALRRWAGVTGGKPTLAPPLAPMATRGPGRLQ